MVICQIAYGPADATVIPKPHHLLPHLNPDWFYLSRTGLPRLSWRRGRSMGSSNSSSSSNSIFQFTDAHLLLLF